MAHEITTVPSERVLPVPPGTMTYEAFLAWTDEDTWAEWVDGEVIFLRSASETHQDLADFLTALLRHFTEAHQLGVVRSAPFQMKTGPDLPGREPDMIFVAREHLDRLKHVYLDGPADLVVEIVSPESRSRDRGAKFYEYEQGGVREYWLLDPVRRQAELYSLGTDGIYRLLEVDRDGIVHSLVLPGLWLKVEWLRQEPLPLLLHILRQWGLV
ncbi:MAG: Uma2 family endonuclease [Candidatus Tectomicrobia bacterium]|uniref:Uma2 family endonuclease n=1 Tax=Tectimicrobiota bacterium TaxID=2528274 RepID=A0A937W4X2_UNCTE|nr:Uma2 family endonuclease [Candidatus Tectomicrobia bacterium]